MVFPSLVEGKVNRASRTLEGAAGKSVNVAKVLQVLGADPLALGILGGSRGIQIAKVLEQQGVQHEFLNDVSFTRECVTVIDDAKGTVTELVEESRSVPPHTQSELMKVVDSYLPSADAIILSGTIVSGMSEDFYAKVVERAKREGVMVVVDAKGAPLLAVLAHGPDLIKPNREELAVTVGKELGDQNDTIEAMQELERRGSRNVIVTAGPDACLAWDGETGWKLEIPPIEVVNPIGSGDAFTAAATWRILQGDTLGEAARWGMAAGSANALSWMAGELTLEDVELLVERIQIDSF